MRAGRRGVGAGLAAALLAGAGAARADGTAAKGAALFQENCAACHQPNGQGIKGAFPALAGDAFVTGPPGPVASVVLKGRGGMPAFGGDLSNDTVAAVISYVRGAWGNAAPSVSPAEVAAQRAGRPEPRRDGPVQAH